MDVTRAIAAGATGTAVMTALWLVEPSIGLPNIAVGQILSAFMSVTVAHLDIGVPGGWAVHLVVGIVLAVCYARFLADRLPGPSAAHGAIFGVLAFLLAQLVSMPLVGAGVFAHGDPAMLAGSLLGHLVYGVVVGWIYDLPSRVSTMPSTRTA